MWVGETVSITANQAVKWEVNSDLVTKGGETSTSLVITAKDKAGSVTVVAKTECDEKSIDFSIITPEGVEVSLIKRLHVKDVLGTGFIAGLSLLPNKVNFSNIEVSELESTAVGTGILEEMTGRFHGQYQDGKSMWVKCVYYENSNLFTNQDQIYIGQNEYFVPLPLDIGGYAYIDIE